MEAEYRQFHHKNATLSYLRTGTGSEILFLFHGYGQDHTVFSPFFQSLPAKYTFYAFDLFFHGSSIWPWDDTPLSKKYWEEILNQFIRENKIEKFSVLGFSLGAKFALASFESFSTRVDKILLLAPDGIKTNAWYRLATYPVMVRALFKSMIVKPGRFMAIVKLARAVNLIDKGVLRFAQSQMESEAGRKRVYYSWVVFRHLKFNSNALVNLMNAHAVQVIILVGLYDKIITAANLNGFVSKLTLGKMRILSVGHNGLIKESVKVIGEI